MTRNRLLIPSLLSCALGCLAPLSAALAADPASGTINDDTHRTEWSGTLLTPNPGGSDVPVVCEEGTPTCDVYRFEVNLKDPSIDDDVITVTVDWEAPAAQVDVDFYVYNEDTGERVGSATASGGGTDSAVISVVNGHYRVDVIPWTAAAQSYTGSVQFTTYRDEGKAAQIFAGAFAPFTFLWLAAAFVARRRAFIQ